MTPPKRVLCVEPTADICELVCLLLRGAGYESDSAATLAEALARAGACHYDLFIVNDGYPDGTSSELTRLLRALYPLAPVIVFSSPAYERDRHEAIEAGAAAFLAKPGDISLLTRTAERLTGGLTA